MKYALCHPDKEHEAKGLCRTCYYQQWRAANREKSNQISRNYKSRNREKVRQWHREHYWRDPERARLRSRRSALKRLYGLSPDEYERMHKMQKGRCAICSESARKRRLSVDHDHRNGSVRGLLCDPCNSALGRLETPGWYEKAREYLNRTEGRREVEFMKIVFCTPETNL